MNRVRGASTIATRLVGTGVAGLMLAAYMFIAPIMAKAEPVVIGEEHCVVNVDPGDGLNVRTGPGVAAPAIGSLWPGQCGVFVTGPCLGNWCPAEDGHLLGWVHRDYIAMVSPALYCVTGVKIDDVLNLRAGPSASADILTALAPDQCGIAFLPFADGAWQKIRVAGWEGWAARRYLSGQ